MCIETQLEELKKQIQDLKDSNDKTIIATRDSVPSSISIVLMEVLESMKKLHAKIDIVEVKLEPIAEKFNDTKGFFKVFMAVAKYAGAMAAIWYALDLVLTHFKIDKP
jgi:tetrahydromethanopterin S-methyltransferase subunit B